eukprot:3752010-Amphidinium_carterae.1
MSSSRRGPVGARSCWAVFARPQECLPEFRNTSWDLWAPCNGSCTTCGTPQETTRCIGLSFAIFLSILLFVIAIFPRPMPASANPARGVQNISSSIKNRLSLCHSLPDLGGNVDTHAGRCMSGKRSPHVAASRCRPQERAAKGTNEATDCGRHILICVAISRTQT